MINIYKIFSISLLLFILGCGKNIKNSKDELVHNKVDTSTSDSPETRVISLRVTKSQDQLDSQFCWVFSSVTILESMYLEKNPHINENEINISRWYFKESTGSDRYQGAIIDAVNYHSKAIGLVSDADYKRSQTGQITSTTFLGKSMSPFQLRDEIIGDQEFWSYAISSNLSGWHPHPDSTARSGAQAFFIPRSDITRLVKKSLEQSAPIGYWFESHVVVIYGAEYDLNGEALKYYIKDSYPPYFYEKDAKWVHNKIKTLSGISNLESL